MSPESTHDSATDRTLMAEERTYSAWVRTGLTSLATGLAIDKLIPDAQPPWLVPLLGLVLVVVGGFTFTFAFIGYRNGCRHWQHAMPRAIPLWVIGLVSLLLILSAGLAVALIFADPR